MGPGKASYSVCYDSSGGDITFQSLQSPLVPDDSGLYIDQTGTTPLQYLYSSPNDPDHVSLTDGGLNSAGCYASGAMFSSLLTFDPGKFSSGGIESAVGIKGPYQVMSLVSGGHGFAEITPSGNTTLIEWTYLTGTTGQSDSLDGTAIFYISNMADDQHDKIYSNGPGIDCPSLTSNGFTEMAKAPASSTSYTIPIDITSATKPMIVLCPYKSGTYFASGVEIHN